MSGQRSRLRQLPGPEPELELELAALYRLLLSNFTNLLIIPFRSTNCLITHFHIEKGPNLRNDNHPHPPCPAPYHLPSHTKSPSKEDSRGAAPLLLLLLLPAMVMA